VRGVYDLHDYECEKRDAFAALANRVLGIVDPEGNVVVLKLRKSSAASMNRKTIPRLQH
jgi:hypothetical protein